MYLPCEGQGGEKEEEEEEERYRFPALENTVHKYSYNLEAQRMWLSAPNGEKDG